MTNSIPQPDTNATATGAYGKSFISSSSLLEQALDLLNSGMSIIPIGVNKRPAVQAWTPYQEERPRPETVRGWFTAPGSLGIGIICGEVSDNVKVQDIETAETAAAWIGKCQASIGTNVMSKVVIVQTPSGGMHVIYKTPASPGPGRKLAARIVDGKEELLIETRGSKQYIVAVGSDPRCHPLNKEYKLLQGDLFNLPLLSAEQDRMLDDISTSFDERPAGHTRREHKIRRSQLVEEFNETADLQELMHVHGFKTVREYDGELYLQKPNSSDSGHHITLNHRGDNKLRCFSTSCPPFDANRTYTPFEVFALLDHEGDEVAAEEQLASEAHANWLTPEPLNHELSPVPNFPAEILPESLRPWLEDISHRMQCPLEGVAVSALVGLSSVIGAGCCVHPKRRDSWRVVPNLWGAIIGAPGLILKSPTLKETHAPIVALEIDAMQQYEEKRKAYEIELMMFDELSKALKGKIKKAKPAELESIKQQLASLEKPAEPVCKRYQTNDATTEKISELLKHNPRGIEVHKDELVGWFASLEKDGRETDRTFYLESWNGDSRQVVDRIGRGTTVSPRLCLSVMGGMQPAKVEHYLHRCYYNHENDGLLQRLQLAVYPDQQDWKFVDEFPNRKAREQAFAIFKTLAHMDFVAYGAEQESEDDIPAFRFDNDAQEFVNGWFVQLQSKLRHEPESMMSEHLSKFRSLLPSIALILHLVEIAATARRSAIQAEIAKRQSHGAHEIELVALRKQLEGLNQDHRSAGISLRHAQMAARWCDVLEAHARRIYGTVSALPVKAAAELARKIERGLLKDNFAVRDVQRKRWALLTDNSVVKAALEELCAAGWLRENTRIGKWQHKGGTTYSINPLVQKPEHLRA